MKNTIKSFTDMIVWQKAHSLALDIYRQSSIFPDEEKYGLSSQIRRAAVSVTSNIAEGFSRRSMKERGRYYTISLGSLDELQSQLLIAVDLKFLDRIVFDGLAQRSSEVGKMLNRLITINK